jgi:thiamine biosynthesis lipoprotein
MGALTGVRFPVFGGEATVAVTDERALATAQCVVQDELDAIDRACSRFRSDSELTALNGAAERTIMIGAVLRGAIAVALRAAALTDGDVDPTVGQAVRVLGYDTDFASVPRSGPRLAEVARVPGWQRVTLGTDGSVTLPAGVELDLGATAKAWAADVASRRAAEAVECGVLVSLGGDVAVAGQPPPPGWLIGIADWHGARDAQLHTTVAIESGGVATSSTVVRRWTRGSREIHHIVDPRTGSAAASVWRTVSVTAASCADANTASTAAIIRGEQAPEWLTRHELPARLVRRDASVLYVAGWPEDHDR